MEVAEPKRVAPGTKEGTRFQGKDEAHRNLQHEKSEVRRCRATGQSAASKEHPRCVAESSASQYDVDGIHPSRLAALQLAGHFGEEEEKLSMAAAADAATVSDPSQTPIRRNQASSPPAPPRPGAYSGAPGTRPERRSMLQFSLLQMPLETPSPVLESTAAADAGLVEARAVRSSQFLDNLTRAQEVDPEHIQIQKATETTCMKNKTCLAIGVLISATAIGLATFLGFVFGRSSNGRVALAPSRSPSVSPTVAPAASATYPPLILDNLPDYSLASLEDPFSPQALAYAWLENHPNVTNLDPWRRTQLFALATTYYAFDGPKWPLGLHKDWLDYNKQECDWYSNLLGIFSHGSSVAFTHGERGAVCNEQGEYIELHMAMSADFGFTLSNITFPAEIGLLTKLEVIKLNKNGFVGVATAPRLLPPSFFRLTNLKRLHLERNQLSTHIPSQMGLLTNLNTLLLDRNHLYGPIPSQLGLLTNLAFLDLQTNQLTGSIPSQLGRLTSVGRLRLNKNELTGTIPSQFAQLSSMWDLNLEYNWLSGTVPWERWLFLDGVGRIRLQNNSGLSGYVPEHLCMLQAPNCTYLTPGGKERTCGLTFDCSSWLCGCDCGCRPS